MAKVSLLDLQNALNAALPGATSITIKSKDGNCRWNGTQWRETGFIWDVAKMYRIEVPEDCEIILTGETINPAEHPITIPAGGAVWIGFPFSESMTSTEAFAGFAVQGDKVSSKDQSSTYSDRWRGQLGTLDPGKGYIYKSAATVNRTFTFPTSK